MPYSHELDVAVSLARSGASIALKHYGRVARLEKTHVAASQEAVTQADRDVARKVCAL